MKHPAQSLPAATLQEAIQCYAEGKLEQAISLLETILATEPDNLKALTYAAQIQANRGKTDEAIRCLRRVAELQPGHNVWNEMGKLLKDKGDLEQALECFRKVVHQQPDHLEARHQIGHILLTQGKEKESEQELQELLALAPDHTHTKELLDYLLRNRAYKALKLKQKRSGVSRGLATAEAGKVRPLQERVLNLLKYLKKHDSRYRKIRVGSVGDGGYVVPDDLENIDAVLSIGIGDNCSFDEYFADRGVNVYQYDHTVNGSPVPNSRFHFRKNGIGPQDAGDLKTLTTMIAENGLLNKNNLLLKIDVEGAEWESFDMLHYEDFMRFRIIVIELHSLAMLEYESFLRLAERVISKIAKNHQCVHFHPNNFADLEIVHRIPICNLAEATFLRKDRSDFSPSLEPIPSPLDYPTRSDLDEIVLTPFG
ncbi:MAG: tetratricopeptide repeat protein [Magnetococcus sp. YQC-3]